MNAIGSMLVACAAGLPLSTEIPTNTDWVPAGTGITSEPIPMGLVWFVGLLYFIVPISGSAGPWPARTLIVTVAFASTFVTPGTVTIASADQPGLPGPAAGIPMPFGALVGNRDASAVPIVTGAFCVTTMLDAVGISAAPARGARLRSWRVRRTSG